MKVALYEPEIPQNVGSIIRICSCLNTDLILIEPFSFLMTEKNFRRAKMDYNTNIDVFPSFNKFIKNTNGRKILFTPHSSLDFKNFTFEESDILVFGRESNGVEITVAGLMDCCVSIFMKKSVRSLNVAMSVSIALSYLIPLKY